MCEQQQHFKDTQQDLNNALSKEKCTSWTHKTIWAGARYQYIVMNVEFKLNWQCKEQQKKGKNKTRTIEITEHNQRRNSEHRAKYPEKTNERQQQQINHRLSVFCARVKRNLIFVLFRNEFHRFTVAIWKVVFLLLSHSVYKISRELKKYSYKYL